MYVGPFSEPTMQLTMQDIIEGDDIPLVRLIVVSLKAAATLLTVVLTPKLSG